MKAYTCKYSNKQMRKPCTVEVCPARVSYDKDTSGCMHVMYDNKPTLSLADVAYAYDLSLPQAKKQYDEGMRRIKHMTLLKIMLEKVRPDINYQPRCDCGIKTVCSIKQCETRNVMKTILSKFPLDSKVLCVTPVDLLAIFEMRTKFQDYLKRNLPNNQDRIGLQGLFNLSDAEYEFLKQFSPDKGDAYAAHKEYRNPKNRKKL